MEAVGASGDHADLGVDRFNEGVGQPVLDRGHDPGSLRGDRASELDKRRQAAAARPRDPFVKQPDRLLGGQPVDLPELLEQVRAIQPGVGLLDARQLRGLAVGEVLGVLSQREPRTLQILRDSHLIGLARLVSRPRGGSPPARRSRAQSHETSRRSAPRRRGARRPARRSTTPCRRTPT